MTMNFGGPSELPEGGDGGGGVIFKPRPEIAELPFAEAQLSSVVLQEVLRLRERLHALENRVLFVSVGSAGRGAAFAGRFNPAEFPEGDGGGGGGGVTIFRPRPEIAEFPIDAQQRFAQEISALRAQMVELSNAIRTLTQQIESDRAIRYESSWRNAMHFIRSLTIHAEDTFCMREPDRALGGVRLTSTQCEIWIDAVSHSLHALVDGIAISTQEPSERRPRTLA